MPQIHRSHSKPGLRGGFTPWCWSFAALVGLALSGGCSAAGGDGQGNQAGNGAGATGGGAASGGVGGDAGTGGAAASTGTGGDAGSGATGGTDGAGGSGGTADSGSGGTGGFGSDEQCATAPTRETCNNCCVNTHPEGGTALVRLTTECVCKPEHCQNDCASTQCASPALTPPSGSPCETCVLGALDAANAQGCFEEIVANCQADTDCSAPGTCAQQRGCEDKPES